MEPFTMEVKWSELLNRGLNPKVPDLKPQIDKLLYAICNDEVKKRFPKVRNQPWHFSYIRFSDIMDKYTVTLAPGFSPQKG